MKRGILSGIIKVVVVACLIVAQHQVRAQAQETPRVLEVTVVKAVEVVPTGISAAKVYLTGSAKLVAGKADVKFKESLSKFASDIKVSDIKVIVTPVGSWSGIYVMDISLDGFTVMSGAGDLNARFNWIVVGE